MTHMVWANFSHHSWKIAPKPIKFYQPGGNCRLWEESREVVFGSYSNEDFNEEAGKNRFNKNCDVYEECCNEGCSPAELGVEEC